MINNKNLSGGTTKAWKTNQLKSAMKQFSILIILSALLTLTVKAQSARVEPFVDAVPYSLKTQSGLFLTNQEAAFVKDFFTAQSAARPDKIVAVDEGYYHGYRLCYSKTDCNNHQSVASWIQVLTIDEKECIAWFEKTNPELLMVPFLGLKELAGRHKQAKAEFREVYNRYKKLSCRLYRQSEDSKGEEANELSLVLAKYSDRINLQTDQIFASNSYAPLTLPMSDNENSWSLWMQCLEEIDVVGYITLIEYSEIPGSDN